MKIFLVNQKKKIRFKYKAKFKPKPKRKLKRIIIKIFICFITLILFLFIDKITINQNEDIFKINNTSKTKVAMCTIAKKENRYIKYFVEFYIKLGYNHIYFYDNNEIGDEKISDLPIDKKGIKKGFITVINYPRREGNFIADSYYECYENYNLQYDWISFFDIDEYLILEPRNLTIQEFLESPRYNNCESLQLNWRVFTDNEQLDYIDKPLMERFPIETKYKSENMHVKTSVRGRLNYTKIKKIGSQHTLYSNIIACTCSGRPTDWNYYVWPPDFKFASLNHYVTKSINEFFYKKYKTKVDVDKIPEKRKIKLFNYFFAVNKKTQEKVDIFNKIFHTNYTMK